MFYHNWNHLDHNNSGLSMADGLTHSKMIWLMTQEIVNASGSPWELVVAGTPGIGGTFASTIDATTDSNTNNLHVTLVNKADSGDYTQGRLMRFHCNGVTISFIAIWIMDLKTSGGIGSSANKWAKIYSSSGGNNQYNFFTRASGTGNSNNGPYRFHVTMSDDWIWMRLIVDVSGTSRGQYFICNINSFPNNNITRTNFPGIIALTVNGGTNQFVGFLFPGRNGHWDGPNTASIQNATGSSWVWGACRAEIGGLPVNDLPDGLGEVVSRLIGFSHGGSVVAGSAEAVGFLGPIPAIRIIRSSASSLGATITIDGKKYYIIRDWAAVYTGSGTESSWLLAMPVEA